MCASSSVVFGALHRFTTLFLLFSVTGFISPLTHSAAVPVQQNLWAPDGPVAAVSRSGTTLYIGGGFSQVGPATGAFAAIDASTGKPNLMFPKVNGTVSAVADDGSGGWYIGGDFTAVN